MLRTDYAHVLLLHRQIPSADPGSSTFRPSVSTDLQRTVGGGGGERPPATSLPFSPHTIDTLQRVLHTVRQQQQVRGVWWEEAGRPPHADYDTNASRRRQEGGSV